MIRPDMSANYKISIVRNVEDVWNNVSILGFFAKLFIGVSEVDSVQGFKTDQMVKMSGQIANSRFSSSVSVEYRDNNEKKVVYRSGKTVYEIGIIQDGDETILDLTMRSPMQDDFILEIYARSLANKIKNILEG